MKIQVRDIFLLFQIRVNNDRYGLLQGVWDLMERNESAGIKGIIQGGDPEGDYLKIPDSIKPGNPEFCPIMTK